MTNQCLRRVVGLVLVSACAVGMAACQLLLAGDGDEQGQTQTTTAAPQQPAGAGLVIENDSPLPETYPRGYYEIRFRAHGGVPVLHWRLEKGALPPGIKLEDDG